MNKPMVSLVRGLGRFPWKALVLASGTWASCGSSGMAFGGNEDTGHHGHGRSGYGTLGYGGHGLYPGFYGFGLSYHPGYGYGGHALGVGADGGYPYYGGPGYPHGEPPLRRLGGIAPFPYYGGPSYSCAGYPTSFEGIGPLVVDRPIVTIGSGPGDPGHAGGYGPFTGARPYPESLFAPYSAAAEATGSSGGASPSSPSAAAPDTAPAPGFGQRSAFISPGTREVARLPARARALGIDEEPVVDADGVRGMKVSNVSPGTAAEKAGLQAGDVIRSINGYLAEQPGHLAWIITNVAPGNVLKMNVRKVSDGKEQTVTARLP